MYQCSQPFAQNLEHITVDSPGLYVLNNGLSTSVSTGGPDGALVRNMVFERKCSCYTASVKASSVSLEASIPVSFFQSIPDESTMPNAYVCLFGIWANERL